MAELAEIKQKIADTEAKIKKAEDEGKSEAYLISLQTTLSEQTAVWKTLLASQGKFQLLSLLIAISNPLLSTFVFI